MTREQIIEQLDSIVGTYEILLGNGVNSDILDVDDIEAIREAISALSENKEDMVSRGTLDQIMWERDTAIQQLKDLGYSLGEKPKEGDLISRKSLLNKINAYVVGSQDKEFICKLIKEMPSAENKGEWTEWKGRNGRYKGIPICSNCNTGFPIFAKDYNYCPNCGARMKGGE